jgi:hypothetical protein
MAWLKTAWSEFFGLFVDDGSFAVAILLWLAVAGLILPRIGLPAALPPAILFAGLVVILVESATRRARGARGG